MRAGPPLFIGQIMTVFEVARPAPAGEHGMDRHDPYAAALARCIALLGRVSDLDGDRAPRLGNADLSWNYCPEHDWVASRSEEGRAGKACGSRCRSRWSPHH